MKLYIADMGYTTQMVEARSKREAIRVISKEYQDKPIASIDEIVSHSTIRQRILKQIKQALKDIRTEEIEKERDIRHIMQLIKSL